MPIALSEIRAKFPMYDNVSDEQLVIGLHRKFYSDIPFKDFNAAIVYDNKADATEGMSSLDKFRAGLGKSIVDTGRGLGQLVGAVDRQDVADSRRIDSDLMKTTEGKVGNFTGQVATTVPLAFVPGANTLKGAALIGSLQGLAAPSASTGETAQNMGLGGVAGPAGLLLGRGAAAAYQAGTGAIRPFFKKGQEQVAAEILRSAATNADDAARNASAARELVPGSKPTLGQVANDPGLAQLERTLYNNPEAQGPLARAYANQQAARQKSIADVAGTPDYREAIKRGRQVFANEDYANAMAQGIDLEMAKAMKPQIDSLMKRPSIQSAKMIAKSLAAEKDIKLDNFGSIEGMDWLKKALDNQISAAKKPGSAIGNEQLRTLVQTKDDLMNVLEQIAPAYKTANDNFAKMSRQVNSMDAAAELQKRLYKNAQWGSGKEMGSTYMTELEKALESVKKSTGMDVPLDKVMNPKDVAALEAIAKDLARKEAGQNLGSAKGSPTMQNMMGQNLLERIVGPLGMPKSFAQNALANTVARPFGYLTKIPEARITAVLSEAMADPQKAAALLKLVQEQSRMGLLANSAEKYLPVAGLLAAESGR